MPNFAPREELLPSPSRFHETRSTKHLHQPVCTNVLSPTDVRRPAMLAEHAGLATRRHAAPLTIC
jgi:hypothetical protein